ncbi:MAG: glycosyltransferase family 39 protein [Armatimonadota bacterium]|nr:glycosyltransferase family 39 protein [bacterium]
MPRYLYYVLLAALCAVLFFWRLGGVPLTGLDEGLYAECSREMTATGNYLVPQCNGETFFDKPPLCYWLQAGSMHAFGVNSFAARLPSAIAGALLVALTVFIGTRLSGRSAGVASGFVLASCILTTGLARMAIMDQLFALTITAALGFFILTYLGLISRHGYVWFWAAVGLSVLVKGPAGAVLIGATIFAFIAIRHRWGVVKEAVPVLGIIIFLAIAVPWYVLVQNETGGAFLREFIIHQNIQRAMGEDFHHNLPFYFYIPIFIMGFFPWSVFVPLGWMARVRLRPSDKLQEGFLFIAVWMATIFIVFSSARSKLPSYIYPMFPASAVLVGAMWSACIKSGKLVSLRRYAWVALAIAVLIAAAIQIGQQYLRKPIPGLSTVLLLMGASLVVSSTIAVIMLFRGHGKAAFAALCAGTAGFLIVAFKLGLPIAAQTIYNPVAAMGQDISASASKCDAAYAFDLTHPQPALAFYAQRPVPKVLSKHNLSEILDRPGKCLLVVQDNTKQGIPQGGKLIASHGKLLLYEF